MSKCKKFKKTIINILLFMPMIALTQTICDKLHPTLNAVLQQSVTQYNLPGLSVSIQFPAAKQPCNYVVGYSNLSTQSPIMPDTLFQVGSITKTFTAVIILKLAEEHKIQLQDKLSKWLPQYPKWKDVTVKQLLNHTSGVFNYIDSKNFWENLKKDPNRIYSLSELANMADSYENYTTPGKSYHYTNTDYILLGLIIEKITHDNIKTVYEKMLFTPYGLNHTFYSAQGYPPSVIKNLSHGYDDEGTFGFKKDVTFLSTSFASSSGAIISTPADINHFIQLLFQGKIISKKSLSIMQELVSEQDGRSLNKYHLDQPSFNKASFQDIGAGLGMGLLYLPNAGLVWVHAGGMPGYQSLYMYQFKTGLSLVLAYNIQPEEKFIFLKIAQTIFAHLSQSI